MSSQLHNPFESTFELFKALRDEVENLKTEVQELHNAKQERFERLESKVEALHHNKFERFETLEADVSELKSVRNARFEAMAKSVEEMQHDIATRFEKLETSIAGEVNDRFTTTQALDKKLRGEVAILRTHCEKNTADIKDYKSKTDMAFSSHLQRHMDLRQDVERLAALLSDNSMSKDPFTGLGVRLNSPQVKTDSRLYLPYLTSTQSIKGSPGVQTSEGEETTA
mmetsp:Transcript_123694/g.194035  ORF Transcript_123694/g.194035 Transcript_123694/m.194035 type:complete len:226 (-) Transcript_123694:83-760(-)